MCSQVEETEFTHHRLPGMSRLGMIKGFMGIFLKTNSVVKFLRD
jgi:hypothetical protein